MLTRKNDADCWDFDFGQSAEQSRENPGRVLLTAIRQRRDSYSVCRKAAEAGVRGQILKRFNAPI